jgi:hypothetical protein
MFKTKLVPNKYTTWFANIISIARFSRYDQKPVTVFPPIHELKNLILLCAWIKYQRLNVTFKYEN